MLHRNIFKYLFIIVIIFGCKSNPKWNLINAKGNCTARHECGFVAHKDALYLIGGRGDKPVNKFTIANNTWSSLKQPPIEMNHITPVSFNGSIYIVSGLTGDYPLEIPLTLKISTALSKSPPDSLTAKLQSLKPAPVASLSCFTFSISLILI